MEIRQLNFDVSRGGVQHRLLVCVGDTLSRTVVARFFSGGDPVPITAAYLRGKREDGGQIYGTCTVEDNTAAYTFAATDLSAGGVLLCEFDLHNGESVMTSPRFAVMVADKLYNGAGAEGSNEYEAYISALLKLENLTATAEAGEAAAATATVGDTAVQLHFVLPKGDKGDKGEQGNVGAKGDKGDPGEKGADGAKGDKGDKGDAFTYGDFTEAQLAALKGAKGDKGDKGNPGADGKTPVKGVDYWTPTEAAEMDAAKTAANNAADNASVAEAAALNAASAADEAASSASISAQNADTAAGEARTKAAELQAKADAGDFNGQDGYTPVRGTDYWTDADKAAINADIAAQVAGKVDKIDGKGLSTNDYTDADKAAVVLLGKNVTLLKEITTTEEASVIALLDNVKIRNFFVEAEIAKAAANTAGQLILSYTDGSSVYCTIANSFNSARVNKSSYIGYDIHGMQPILCRNQSTSGISGTYAALSSFHYGNNAASKIRYHSVDSTVVPVGSKFTVYGILED